MVKGRVLGSRFRPGNGRMPILPTALRGQIFGHPSVAKKSPPGAGVARGLLGFVVGTLRWGRHGSVWDRNTRTNPGPTQTFAGEFDINSNAPPQIKLGGVAVYIKFPRKGLGWRGMRFWFCALSAFLTCRIQKYEPEKFPKKFPPTPARPRPPLGPK